jgi:uncharacterized glyoxalase superfamily protein PhnB
MAVKAIPEGYHSVTPYLVANDARGLLTFILEAFGAQERMITPTPDGRIGHGEVQLGDSVIMLGDAVQGMEPFPAMVHLYVEDCDAAYERALRSGAESLREPATQFYGDRSAGVKDRWGNTWWMATHVEDVTPEEMARRAKAAAPGA